MYGDTMKVQIYGTGCAKCGKEFYNDIKGKIV